MAAVVSGWARISISASGCSSCASEQHLAGNSRSAGSGAGFAAVGQRGIAAHLVDDQHITGRGRRFGGVVAVVFRQVQRAQPVDAQPCARPSGRGRRAGGWPAGVRGPRAVRGRNACPVRSSSRPTGGSPRAAGGADRADEGILDRARAGRRCGAPAPRPARRAGRGPRRARRLPDRASRQGADGGRPDRGCGGCGGPATVGPRKPPGRGDQAARGDRVRGWHRAPAPGSGRALPVIAWPRGNRSAPRRWRSGCR